MEIKSFFEKVGKCGSLALTKLVTVVMLLISTFIVTPIAGIVSIISVIFGTSEIIETVHTTGFQTMFNGIKKIVE